MATTFSTEQLNTLRAEYAMLQTVSTDALGRFRAIFAGCTDEAIRQLVAANIKFVSKLAVNELIRRGLVEIPETKAGVYKSANGRPFMVGR